jgi:hypothetical protein
LSAKQFEKGEFPDPLVLDVTLEDGLAEEWTCVAAEGASVKQTKPPAFAPILVKLENGATRRVVWNQMDREVSYVLELRFHGIKSASPEKFISILRDSSDALTVSATGPR